MDTEYYAVLEVTPGSSREEIDLAYSKKMSYWQGLRAHSSRRSEADRMIARLDEAYEALLLRFSSGEGGLEEPSTSAATGDRNGEESDTGGCPHCGYRKNPSGARFCISCQGQLYHTCPKCATELPWHQAICHQCGVRVEEERQAQLAAEARRREQQIQDERRRQQAEHDSALVERKKAWRNLLIAVIAVLVIIASIIAYNLGQAARESNAISSLNGRYIQINQRAFPSDGSIAGVQIPNVAWGVTPAATVAEPPKPEYFADILRVGFSDRNIIVEFEAHGAADLLRPWDSCLLAGDPIRDMFTGMERTSVVSSEFTVNSPEHYAGKLLFPIDLLRSKDNTTFYFLYGCMYDSIELFNRYDVIDD